jgi:hypothetical protein
MAKHVLAAAMVAVLALTGSGRADDKKPAKAPLPRADSVEWDVTVVEDSPSLKLIKREVKTGQVVWLVENRKSLPNGLLYTFVAEFLDEDGVKLFAIQVPCDLFPANWREGERNRLILELPQAGKWKNVTKVVIKGG